MTTFTESESVQYLLGYSKRGKSEHWTTPFLYVRPISDERSLVRRRSDDWLAELDPTFEVWTCRLRTAS
jgi:hypothetical protein